MLSLVTTETAAQFAELYNSHIQPLYSSSVSPDAQEEYSRFMNAEEIKEDIGAGYVYMLYTDGAEVLGGLYYKYKDDQTAYLGGFYIFQSEQRRSGYGQKMLTELENYLKEKHINHILLETRKDFVWATSFYLKNGFTLLTNENLGNSYYKKFYTHLVEDSPMFFKEII